MAMPGAAATAWIRLPDSGASMTVAISAIGLPSLAAWMAGGLNRRTLYQALAARDLAVDINRATLRDPDLYEATLNGGLTVQGPLLGGAMIAGKIALTETELRVPSTGFGGAGGLPGLAHAHELAWAALLQVAAGYLKAISGFIHGAQAQAGNS